MKLVFILQLLSSITLHAVFIVIFYVLAVLSKILGDALKKRPLYRLMYLAILFEIIAHICFYFGNTAQIYRYILDITALLIGCIVTVYYWKWLPGDLKKG